MGPLLGARDPTLMSFPRTPTQRSEEHTSELQSLRHLVCRLLLEKKKLHRRYDVDRDPDEQLPRRDDDDEHARPRTPARVDPQHRAEQTPGRNARQYAAQRGTHT